MPFICSKAGKFLLLFCSSAKKGWRSCESWKGASRITDNSAAFGGKEESKPKTLWGNRMPPTKATRRYAMKAYKLKLRCIYTKAKIGMDPSKNWSDTDYFCPQNLAISIIRSGPTWRASTLPGHTAQQSCMHFDCTLAKKFSAKSRPWPCPDLWCPGTGTSLNVVLFWFHVMF